MQWVIEQTVDLQHAIPHGAWPEPLAVTGDSQAHEWRVRILENGAPAALDGCSCKGYFVRGDGQTVLAEGSIAEAIAAVVLPQACYAVPGAVRGLLRISRDGVVMTAAVLSLHVIEGPGDAIVDPGEVIPSLDELLAQVAAMEALNDDVSTAEAGRVAAEQERVTAEEGREEAEDARASAESGRASAEQARETAEQARAAAEAERVANEDERQQQLTNAINAAEADADRAEAAADAAETLIAMPPLFSNTPPTEAPTLNKLWIDTGVSPTVLRRWRGADVPTGREYQQTISADTGSASLSIDNAQGQLRSVALEMGCVAKQAGSGDPSPENIRAISGRESVEIAACRKNLFPSLASAVTVSGLTVSPQADGTVVISGTATRQVTVYTYTGTLPDGKYTISGGTHNVHVALIAVDANNQWKRTIGLSFGNPGTFNLNGLLDGEDHVRMMIQTANDFTGQTFDNVVISPQLEVGGTATAFEPYRSMGGGTVAPSAPLYGLPGAEDTVEVPVDGDVTVTRRTAVLELDGTENWATYETSVAENVRFRLSPDENIDIEPPANNDTVANILCSHYTAVPNTQNGTFNCVNGVSVHAIEKSIMVFDNNYATENVDTWKSYLAAQKTAGTPVTIVYELAAPTTETPADVDPIVPEKGQLNIYTDANALSTTVHGSGWDTISDQTGLVATIAQLTARVAALEQAAVNESTGG